MPKAEECSLQAIRDPRGNLTMFVPVLREAKWENSNANVMLASSHDWPPVLGTSPSRSRSKNPIRALRALIAGLAATLSRLNARK
jgi:hypothetical protein